MSIAQLFCFADFFEHSQLDSGSGLVKQSSLDRVVRRIYGGFQAIAFCSSRLMTGGLIAWVVCALALAIAF